MKVVHVISGLGDGGAEAALYRLCIGDRRNSHVVVSLSGLGIYGGLFRSVGVFVHCLGIKDKFSLVIGFIVLIRILIRERPDVVQSWMDHGNFLGGLAARLVGIKRVYWGIHHSNASDGGLSPRTGKINALCARLSGHIPFRIVSCAETATKAHVSIGYDPKKFSTIPNGYDLLKFAESSEMRTETRSELGLSETEPVIGLVARWDPLKDHLSFLHAVVQVRKKFGNVKCLLIGVGCDKSNTTLCQKVAELGLEESIRLLGRSDNIPALMNALDVHVLSSVSEAFPNVVAEAMACGTPCVVTDVGDAALIVGDTGWVVPPGHPECLATAIAEALKGREDAIGWKQRRAASSKRIQSNFSLNRMVDAYNDIWGASF